jgi:hypothetical protein
MPATGHRVLQVDATRLQRRCEVWLSQSVPEGLMPAVGTSNTVCSTHDVKTRFIMSGDSSCVMSNTNSVSTNRCDIRGFICLLGSAAP